MHDDALDGLLRVIRTKIGAERSRRLLATRDAMNSLLGETFSVRRSSRFPIALERICAEEYEWRAKKWLEVATSCVSASRARWTRQTAARIGNLVTQELVGDWNGLLDFYRNNLGTHDPNRRTGLFDGAKDRCTTEVANDLALLVLGEEGTRAPLVDQLAAPRYSAVSRAWLAALELRDKAGSGAQAVRTAVGAVEQLARVVTRKHDATLGDCIRTLRGQGLSPPLLKGLEEIWGWSSNEPGIRHGASSTDPASADVEYVLKTCEALLGRLLALDAL